MCQNEREYKILILYHVPERELNSCLMIADSIKKLEPKAKTVVIEFYQGMYFALLYKPDAILTIPPRDASSANRLTIVKNITNCAVLSLLTEGYYQTFSDDNIQIAVGTNKYSPNLIDKYLFWGEKTRKHFVSILKKNNKITDEARSGTIGYVYYDVDAIRDFFKEKELPDELQKWEKDFNRRILVLTGFPLAEYTKDEQIIMSAFRYHGVKGKEKEYEQEIQEWKKKHEKFLMYRNVYLNCIIQFARSYPDVGILIKLHPVELEGFLKTEKYQCYRELERISNILLLRDSILLGRILPCVDAMIHYGSTSGLEAYIYDVPTIHLCDSRYEEKAGEPGFCIYESTVKIDVNSIKTFNEIVYNGIEHRYLQSVEKVLEEQFNWTRDKRDQYHPTMEYAKTILDSIGSGQKLKDDSFYKKALHSDSGRDIKRYFVRGFIRAIVQKKGGKAVKYKKILKELRVSMIGGILIELRVLSGKIKRKIIKYASL